MKIYKYIAICSLTLLFTLTSIPSYSYSADSSYERKLKEALQALNSRNYGNAQDLFSALVNDFPDRPEGNCGLAFIEITYKNYPAAKMYASKASAINPGYAQCYYILGVCEEQLKAYAEAVKYYNKYLYLEPDSRKKDRIIMRIEYINERLSQ